MAALGPGITNVIIVVVFVSIPPIRRISRGSILAEKVKPYILAAKSLGVGDFRIMFRHILPNTLPHHSPGYGDDGVGCLNGVSPQLYRGEDKAP